jgi:hypothetical protein
MPEIVTALENLDYTMRICGFFIIAVLLWIALK